MESNFWEKFALAGLDTYRIVLRDTADNRLYRICYKWSEIYRSSLNHGTWLTWRRLIANAIELCLFFHSTVPVFAKHNRNADGEKSFPFRLRSPPSLFRYAFNYVVAMLRPRPVPCRISFVLWNGFKYSSLVLSDMPYPSQIFVMLISPLSNHVPYPYSPLIFDSMGRV